MFLLDAFAVTPSGAGLSVEPALSFVSRAATPAERLLVHHRPSGFIVDVEVCRRMCQSFGHFFSMRDLSDEKMEPVSA